MLLEIYAVPGVLMIEILTVYNVYTRPTELLMVSTASVVFSAADATVNVSVTTSFPASSHEVTRVSARPNHPEVAHGALRQQ